jgi:hypothetical protein
MMKVKNVSPYGDLDVPALGKIIESGETVEIENDEIALSLLAQTAHFAPVGQDTRKAAKELNEEGAE